MLTPRFYIEFDKLELGEYLIKDDFILSHIKALRMRINDNCSLFNGVSNYEWHANIKNIDKKSVTLKINNCYEIKRKLTKSINLIQSFINPTKLELIVEKVTELGIDNIYLTQTAYSNVNLTNENKEKKLHRLSKLIISACEQCGRNVLPHLSYLEDWQNCLSFLKKLPHDTLKIFLSTDIANSIKSNDIISIKNISDINIKNYEAIYYIIGAEGGFSHKEQADLLEIGCIGVSLGNIILRAETASIAVLSYLNFTLL